MSIQRHKKRIQLVLLSLSLIFLFTLFNAALRLFVFFPDESKIIAGKGYRFSINVPVTLSVGEQSNVKNSNIDVTEIQAKKALNSLKKSFIITSKQLGEFNLQLKLFGIIPIRKMTINVMPDTKLVPCGKTVGVKLYTEGLLVLGTGEVVGQGSKTYKPSQRKIQSGDVILKVENKDIRSLSDLKEILNHNQQSEIDIMVKRDEKIKNVKVRPIQDQDDHNYKLGLWVREGTQGIGTVTFYDPKEKRYGALGHAITDIDTEQIMSVKNGEILSTEIQSVKKGKKGQPGELIGAFLQESELLGNIEINTPSGIFGKAKENNGDFFGGKSYPIALRDEIKEGKAYILANIVGNKVEKFDVNIQKVYRFDSNDTKQMIIKIIDKRLLNKTGGIVQGMSGSPIIQNGKIIGAVTHVFVNDPTKGFGIFIENMIQAEKNIK